MLLIPSGENRSWPWTGAPERRAEQLFAKEFPAVYAHLKPLEPRLRSRADQGQHWWELRSCAYYAAFDAPKLIWKDLSYHSQFAIDDAGLITNDLCFILPARQHHLWLAAVLNSPLMWWYAWRNTLHGKDEVLRLKSVYTEPLPIASATARDAVAASLSVQRLVTLSQQVRDSEREVLNWLRCEFAVDVPGQKLESFGALEADDFIDEVKRRRPRKAAGLTPRDVGRLTETYREYSSRIREMTRESGVLEAQIATLVNRAYGLTADEVELMWRTAPPRMPVRNTAPAHSHPR